jgi:hypothetical protein
MLLVGCPQTTVDPSVTTQSPADTTTTTVFVASGTTAELLAALLARSQHLSDLIVDDDGQEEALARIEQIWAAVSDDIEATRPELVPGFETAIDLLRTGVERRRPADADKAYNNLRTLVAAYTG